ncbi:tetratricopeptide repeat protein [Aquimarina sp. 2201CG5-10]|uniref:tetratricopeptide repeat protein n=1 Tax=Aquimarina callyspongiae TaxID=3098150 RepID=UPI002AB482BC|nr:tetratricopeptide repeat protein [Aquimarina sp. 2201CG5-10]MDY8138635.1 tetratricopeptide repeat protein [Aquimarina sp. 2201CG5-10]
MNLIKEKKNLYFIVFMVILTTITYLNHFDNSFHFDDTHTIQNNVYVRSLKNIPLFFKDGSTISSLPQNQSYRPIVATSLAIDYWLGNSYNPFYFHLISFLLFLFQGILIFFLAKRILKLSSNNNFNFYIAAGITLWYMLHPVMAETVNYIIARSDLQSTFFVVLAFVIYQYSAIGRKFYLYLVAVIIGALAKPIAIMFAPLLFCYLLLFKHNMSFYELFSSKSSSKSLKVLKETLPSFLVCLLLYFFITTMTPDTYTTGASNVYNYLITQPYVVTYYFGSILFPIHLSADTDWVALESIWSYKFFIGILFILVLVYILLRCSKKRKYYPISFGIAWFFIALIPTSSFFPLSEVMNDHRMFFPYVGSIIGSGYAIGLLAQYIKEKYKVSKLYILSGISILLLLYAFGTYQRNQVWDNNESLWKDVTLKSPKNGRGLMNYGLTLMSKGQYKTAEQYFLKALKLTPYYHTLHINLGILYNAQGNATEAEKYFKEAIEHGPNYYSSWFYYGRFLSQKSRKAEAIQKLSKSLELSPSHMETRILLMENYLDQEDWKRLNEIAYSTTQLDKDNKKAQLFLLASIQKISKLDMEEREVSNNPTPEQYLNLSLKYYQNKQYQKCIDAARKVLQLKPESYEAYNNICTAYNLLGNYDEAINACNKALELNPDYDLAKNNLTDIMTRKSKIQNLNKLLIDNPNEVNYLNLSLLYYNYGFFKKCITISEKGVIAHPKSDKLYNNLCAAYNSLNQWSKAIEAGKKGLLVNPSNQLLRNNYNLALANYE